ncbi:MAG: ComEC/Rec2 family competence protein [Phycisphaerales bacterium]
MPDFVRARRRAWATLFAGLVGVWLSASVEGSSLWWFGAAVVFGIGAVISLKRWWWLPAFVSVVCVMAGWSANRMQEPDSLRADRLVESGAIVTFLGDVRTAPEFDAPPTGPAAPGSWRDPSMLFEFKIEAIDTESGQVPATGILGVRMPAEALEVLRIGQQARVTGNFTHASQQRNPGEPDWSRYANAHNRAGWLDVPSVTLFETRPGSRGGVLGSWLRFRSAMRDRAMRALGVDTDGVLAALVLGERDSEFDETYRVFQRAGVAHVLAVSGFHLAMLGWIAAMLIRMTGERGRLELFVAVGVVGAMLFMVPARAPIMRAGVLVLVLLIGDVVGRRWDRLSLLAWAGLGLLVWRPMDATGLGYLLSVGVTALLIATADRDRLRDYSLAGGPASPRTAWKRSSRGPVLRWLKDAFRMNVSCWAVATPTIVAFTGVCSVIAPIATIVMVPLAGGLLVVGWLQAQLGIVSPAVSERTMGVVDSISGVVGAVARRLDALPFSSVSVVGVGWLWAGVTTVCVLGWMFRYGRRRWFGFGIGACVLYATLTSQLSGRVDGIRIDMLDVGDGTCLIVRSGGETMLWDCGGLHRPVGGMVAEAARALGVRRVRTAIITHANLDHFNGLPEVAQRLGIETVFVPPALAAAEVGDWAHVRDVLTSSGIRIVPVSAGDIINVGRARGNVLWPSQSSDQRWLGNDGSMVIRLSVETDEGERSALLFGDLQTAGVAGLMDMMPVLKADVIEAPHHGSANAAAVELVERVAPRVVLQSTGRGRVGLPMWNDVRSTSEWLSTAELGAVYAHIRRNGRIEMGISR